MCGQWYPRFHSAVAEALSHLGVTLYCWVSSFWHFSQSYFLHQGRPKNRWEDDIRNDMKKLKIKNWISCIQDHNKWKSYVERVKTFEDWSCSAWRRRRLPSFGLSHLRIILGLNVPEDGGTLILWNAGNNSVTQVTFQKTPTPQHFGVGNFIRE